MKSSDLRSCLFEYRGETIPLIYQALFLLEDQFIDRVLHVLLIFSKFVF